MVRRRPDPAPRPLAGHPGHVFVAGERVSLRLPEGEATWRLVDVAGNHVSAGQAVNGGAIELGKLAAGYYELRQGARRTALAVLPRLTAPTPADSPVALDVAMAWFYKGPQRAAIARLCSLAGIGWVRDRLAWGEVEPERGRFVRGTRSDDSARIQGREGLAVLQVNHSTPGWAGGEKRRYPDDLRDVFNCWRQLAGRWRGQVRAVEPWNEPDMGLFGGHIGAETAALQKAAWFGLKAGNPEVIVCLSPLAFAQARQLADLAANEVWAYFETANLHHYAAPQQYPGIYAAFRALAGGKPLWTTEFNQTVEWSGDEGVKEISDENMAEQARRVAKVFAYVLHEGLQRAFYFMLPQYCEGQVNYGLLRGDLTPRPAFVSLAAVGRLLAGAQALGSGGRGSVRVFAFAARPDGRRCEVVVAWADGKTGRLKLPVEPVAVYDHFGREVPATGRDVELDAAPRFALLPVGTAQRMRLRAPPAPAAPPRQRRTCPVVLQPLVPAERSDLNNSAYLVSAEGGEIAVAAYHFGLGRTKVAWHVEAPAGWRCSLAGPAMLKAGERPVMALRVLPPKRMKDLVGTVKVTANAGRLGRSVLALRLIPFPLVLVTRHAQALAGAGDAANWTPRVGQGSTSALAAEGGGVTVTARMTGTARWCYPELAISGVRTPRRVHNALRFTLTRRQGPGRMNLFVVTRQGAAWNVPLLRQCGTQETGTYLARFADATHAPWTPEDPAGRLRSERITGLQIGGDPEGEMFVYGIAQLEWVTV